MKKVVVLIILVLGFISCKKEEVIPEDSVKVSGLIAHKNNNTVEVIGRGDKEAIYVQPDGTFSKTFKLKDKGFYTFYDGKNKFFIYLKGGDDLDFLYDYKNPDSLFVYKGKAAATNTFLRNKNKFERENAFYNAKKLYTLNPTDFKKRISFYKEEIKKLLSNDKIDAEIKERYSKEYDRIISNMENGYKASHGSATPQSNQSAKKGKPSPNFIFENAKGGTTSLKDLKGKYVYIDVWATWCGPCKQQIPYLKKLEKKFKNKSIQFVSISVDDARRNGGSWEKAKAKWLKFVKDNKLGGIQLFADKGWQSDFIKQYGIRGIPRFILLDKQGNIINENAPRPSQQLTETLLGSLK